MLWPTGMILAEIADLAVVAGDDEFFLEAISRLYACHSNMLIQIDSELRRLSKLTEIDQIFTGR